MARDAERRRQALQEVSFMMLNTVAKDTAALRTATEKKMEEALDKVTALRDGTRVPNARWQEANTAAKSGATNQDSSEKAGNKPEVRVVPMSRQKEAAKRGIIDFDSYY